jgi:hypothetical protein
LEFAQGVQIGLRDGVAENLRLGHMEKLLRDLPFDVASTFKKSVQFFQAFVSFQIAETGFAHFDVFL